LAVVASSLLWFTVPAAAQQAPVPTLNWAFATQLGSGIYQVNGQTIQIYRITVPWRLTERTDERPWGLRLTFPVTVGFFNFRLDELIDKGFPEDLSTAALVPTLEMDIRAKNRWWLAPFAGAGVGEDFTNNELSYIVAVGLNSLVHWPWGSERDWLLANRLVYSGYGNDNIDFVDDFGVLATALNLRQKLGANFFGHQLDVMPFIANYIYLISPRLFVANQQPAELRTEWELGAILGTVTKLRILGIGLPSLGLSYRFGTGADAWRIVIGNPFPMISPIDDKAELY